MPRPLNSGSERAKAARLTDELGYEVTRKMLRVWTEKGYNLDDVESLRAELESQQRMPNGSECPEPKAAPVTAESVECQIGELRDQLLAATDKRTAETIKIKIAGLNLVLKMLREQGEYMKRADAYAAGAKAATASRGAWEKIEDELPPQLEGLTAAQMKVKLRAFARARCVELAELFS